MPDVHAILSASSSHRWLNCPPSARLAAQFPESTSSYAEAGRIAHAIAELKARKYFLEPMSTRTYNARMKKLKADPHYAPDMDAATDMYLEHLQEIGMSFELPPFVALETRVDYSHLAPEGFGTADCIIIGDGKLYVVDYKNGSGVPVEAEGNSQMMLYALGALKVYRLIFGDSIQEIHMSIVQPHAGGVKAWSLLREELEAWGETVAKPAALLAYKGEGEFRPGDWCDKNYCPARATCTARARKLLELEPMMGQEPPLLTDDQIGGILTRALNLQKWVEGLKEYAEKTILAGGHIAGFKMVEGRGSRDWNDLDAAFETLQQRGVAEAMLYERKPVSVAGLEKVLGKKAFAETAEGLWQKKPGKPALVPESDKRPAYNAAAIAFGVADDGG